MITPEEQETIDSYNIIAKPWVDHRISGNFYLDELNQFKELLPPPGNVIDLGCAGGRESVWFKQNGYEYVGVDASSEMIVEARKKFPDSTFERMELSHLEFEDGAFDGFWAAAVLLHISRKNIVPVLKEIKRIIKPGAVGFISIKQGQGEAFRTWDEIPNSPKGFFVFYEIDEFKRILLEAGFAIIQNSRKPSGNDKVRDFLTFFVKSV